MAACGLDMDWYVHRHRGEHEVLPWDHIGAGLHRDFLWQDWQDALAGHGLTDCRWTPCYDCGACTEYGIEHIVASPVAPNGGSQGTGQDLAAGIWCRSSFAPASWRAQVHQRRGWRMRRRSPGLPMPSRRAAPTLVGGRRR